MRLLQRERADLERYLPGLDGRLAEIPLAELERPGSPGPNMFRDAGGPGLVIPAELEGLGADAVAAVRVQRALGSRSPSLAVATTMHHFSVSSLALVAEDAGNEWLLLEAVATQGLLVASGFAEGRPDGRILAPTMTATVTPEGLRVSGVKRPCSLARSMDLLTASVVVPGSGGDQLGVALIPATDPGVTVTPFWSSFALAGAESDQVTIENVLVPSDLVILTGPVDGAGLDEIQIMGFVWFELLMTASYLGAATALVERALGMDRVSDSEKLRLVIAVEAAMAGVENIARQVADGHSEQRLLADVLLVRYAAQDAIAAVVPRAAELLGGLHFLSADDVGYLAAAVNGLGFHPPARAKMAGPLAEYAAGSPLRIA
ncbi:acyl-CoA dehydrogenase family protein [Nocardia crassostreae]|uniref:acyl-CoA dehydrogenase family protein n=1 Tax=Nocardia crassostreae TaxID=53428 RepID=UPI00082BB8E1|nr:acyl-CoA dehydrogenase family protein [Nocardia crassostreae]